MPIRVNVDEVCDARDDDSSNAVDKTKKVPPRKEGRTAHEKVLMKEIISY